jgi:hypothetical protein
MNYNLCTYKLLKQWNIWGEGYWLTVLCTGQRRRFLVWKRRRIENHRCLSAVGTRNICEYKSPLFKGRRERTAGEIFTIFLLYYSYLLFSLPLYSLLIFSLFNGGGGDAVSRRPFIIFFSPTVLCLDLQSIASVDQPKIKDPPSLSYIPSFLMAITIWPAKSE